MKKVQREKEKIARAAERAERKEKKQSMRSIFLKDRIKIQQRKNVGVNNTFLRKQVLNLENKVKKLDLSAFNGSLSQHKASMNVQHIVMNDDVSDQNNSNEIVVGKVNIKRRRRSNNNSSSNNNNSNQN